MPCNPLVNSKGEFAGFICSRGRQPRTRCVYCNEICERLCDFPVGKRLKRAVRRDDGSLRYFRECNTPMCVDCAQKVYTVSEFDFCKEHIAAARAAYERRKAKLLDGVKTEGVKADEKV